MLLLRVTRDHIADLHPHAAVGVILQHYEVSGLRQYFAVNGDRCLEHIAARENKLDIIVFPAFKLVPGRLGIDAEIFIAPNPYRPSEGPQNVAIYNMSPEGTLTITTIANEVVRILDGNSGGAVAWDVTNSNGKNLASDVYLCYYKDHDRVDKFKFVVIR